MPEETTRLLVLVTWTGSQDWYECETCGHRFGVDPDVVPERCPGACALPVRTA